MPIREGRLVPSKVVFVKRRDGYLRTLLIHGARAVIAQFERKPDPANGWLKKLLSRRNKNIAAVALAAKNARIARVLLAHERRYEGGYVATRPGRIIAAG